MFEENVFYNLVGGESVEIEGFEEWQNKEGNGQTISVPFKKTTKILAPSVF